MGNAVSNPVTWSSIVNKPGLIDSINVIDGIAITSAGTVVVAHGVGNFPKYLNFYLKCISAEGGYSVGDFIHNADFIYEIASSATMGFSALVDDTNITINYGSNANVFTAVNNTTGAAFSLTNSKWNLRIEVGT